MSGYFQCCATEQQKKHQNALKHPIYGTNLQPTTCDFHIEDPQDPQKKIHGKNPRAGHDLEKGGTFWHSIWIKLMQILTLVTCFDA